MSSTSVSPTNGSAHGGNTGGLYFNSGRNIAAILLGLVVFLLACSGSSPADPAEPLPTGTPVEAEPTSEGQACLSPRGAPRATDRT